MKRSKEMSLSVFGVWNIISGMKVFTVGEGGFDLCCDLFTELSPKDPP